MAKNLMIQGTMSNAGKSILTAGILRVLYQDGYRVASVDLDRGLEEDLSIVSSGIVDFGVADMGDALSGKRTPIDLVMEWAPKFMEDPFAIQSARALTSALVLA